MKYSRVISFLCPIYVQPSLMWYSILLGLQYCTRNFNRLLFCVMIPLLFSIFDWAKTEVPSIILIVIGRLDLHDINKFWTDLPCNVTPTYGAKNTHVLLLHGNVTHVHDQFCEMELREETAIWRNMILFQYFKTNKLIKMISKFS